MSLDQIMGAIFGEDDIEGRVYHKNLLTPKEKLDTAFRRFDRSIEEKKTTQKELKQSVCEWYESSNAVNETISRCGNECTSCDTCHFKQSACRDKRKRELSLVSFNAELQDLP